MAPLDWAIVLALLAVIVAGVLLSRRRMRSVADFLAAGRTARRYLLSLAGGIAGLGAITIVSNLQMNYEAGFSLSWWGLTMNVVVLVATAAGWVIYRFRQTRCLTLAEFFERRYSRPFRVFAGLVVFTAGIINFGIFPAVGARFFLHFCGFPEHFSLLGATLPTFPAAMLLLLSISLFFVFAGGQIAVLVTDFLQGLFVNVVFVAIVIYLLSRIGFDPLFRMLERAPPGESLLNPFDTGKIRHFNFWFFLIGVIGFLYGAMSWQGRQAYHVSAKSAHEAKMGGMLGMWQGFPQGLFLFLVPMLVYTVMHHADFGATAGEVTARVAEITGELPAGVREKMTSELRAPLVLASLLPVGLFGAFAAVMLAAFISTHDTYLHSWGSIFVQDVVMPFRGKPLSPKSHLTLLRLAILGVAVFIFLWSLLFQLSQEIALYFAITGAIFAGGAGAVIIGGLYTRWGTTRGAWGALLTGATINLGGVVLKQVADEAAVRRIGGVLEWFYDLDGQLYWGLTMGLSVLAYVALSLLGPRRRFDLERLLHRGKHAIPGETEVVAAPSRGLRALGMGSEFTRGDRFLYLLTYAWVGLQAVVFVIGTVMNLTGEIDDPAWISYWRIYILVHLGISVVVVFWFAVGGFFDLRAMFARLRTMKRDDRDDGVVREEAGP